MATFVAIIVPHRPDVSAEEVIKGIKHRSLEAESAQEAFELWVADTEDPSWGGGIVDVILFELTLGNPVQLSAPLLHKRIATIPAQFE